MARFIIRSLVSTVITLLIVSILLFFLLEVASGDVTRFAWSPDSHRMAYLSDQDTDEVFELYSATLDGSINDKLNGSLVAGGNVSFNFAWSP